MKWRQIHGDDIIIEGEKLCCMPQYLLGARRVPLVYNMQNEQKELTVRETHACDRAPQDSAYDLVSTTWRGELLRSQQLRPAASNQNSTAL
eukprot:6481424-Amphidinium_carterae.2